jgi:hypothetical protein
MMPHAAGLVRGWNVLWFTFFAPKTHAFFGTELDWEIAAQIT